MPSLKLKDDVWEQVQAVLPPPKARRFRYPGRKPRSDRDVLNGIIYILGHDVPFDALPTDLGFGTGMTCWNRLMDWKKAKAWPKIQGVLAKSLPSADKFDWSRVDQLGRRKKRKARRR